MWETSSTRSPSGSRSRGRTSPSVAAMRRSSSSCTAKVWRPCQTARAAYSRPVEGVWETLRVRTDYAAFVATPRADLERADLRKRDGSSYTMLKNPAGDAGAGTYVRLEGADVELYELMDGRRTTSEILVEYLQRHGVFDLDRLGRLTAALAVNGFFGDQRPDAYWRPRLRRALRDPLVRLSGWLRRLVVWDIATWNNAAGVVDLLYRAGG